ncbi:MAG: flagellar motor stator protein MotA [Rhodospirillales bacterium]|jgi:chemotaxis protein MotA|nr:flagellar motor stator protein MotA [Rhodospirillales bacterium]MBT4007153.1 flagellar motor stator protein MotA [Rhodospirillales bacterium]MBT5076672.1 flagellar motor stator protein MotA [Rhodospirillales bacterium]MBT5113486.1 flagellar motor stator protein MotA [Rhodospirillales bacterium]MBT5673784.1 flagellar motor stator protein MotA [Rhodospirillales bacterium]
MLFFVGVGLVLVCVFGGYLAMGGHLYVLYQPFELVIIGGAALGAYIIANPKSVLAATGGGFKKLIAGSRYDKEAYIELLTLQYSIFKLAKSKGMLALEAHVENPEESELFQKFPIIHKDHHALTFLCDYLRMMVLGAENPFEMETLMDDELDTHHAAELRISDALQAVADGMPALGIVAAVLGVIHTMGSITEPPEVLGKLIGGALVGTFLGVLIAYGFFGPCASSLKLIIENEGKYQNCIKVGLLAHMQGNAPSVSVEFARKTLFHDVRPTFYEVEEAAENAPSLS